MTRFPRRSGVKATIGLVVEGETEFFAFKHLPSCFPRCPPLKVTNLSGVGSDRSPVGIAKLVVPKVIAHWAGKRAHVVICIDREQRPDCPGQFANAVRLALTREIATRASSATGTFSVVVANRAFEAWILADASNLYRKQLFKSDFGNRRFEGEMGSEGKKGVVELTKLLGRPYRKLVDGPKLFAEISFPSARHFRTGKGNKSLDKFLSEIGV